MRNHHIKNSYQLRIFLLTHLFIYKMHNFNIIIIIIIIISKSKLISGVIMQNVFEYILTFQHFNKKIKLWYLK